MPLIFRQDTGSRDTFRFSDHVSECRYRYLLSMAREIFCFLWFHCEMLPKHLIANKNTSNDCV